MISSHVKISMISLISSLCLKLFLNSLVYHENIFGSSSKIFDNLRTSSEILGKMFGNVRLSFGTILENLRKSSESGWKSSENHQKRRHQYVYIIKEHYMLAQRHEFYVLVARRISHSFIVLTREKLFLPLKHKIHIFSPPCNILYVIHTTHYVLCGKLTQTKNIYLKLFEMWKWTEHDPSMRKRKKSESRTWIEPMTSRTPGGCSIRSISLHSPSKIGRSNEAPLITCKNKLWSWDLNEDGLWGWLENALLRVNNLIGSDYSYTTSD